MRNILIYLVLVLPVLLSAAPITLISENQDALQIEFKLPDYTLEDVSIKGSNWKQIVCDDGLVHSQEGYPELFVFSTAIAVPADGDYTISVNDLAVTNVKNVKIVPSRKLTLDDDTMESRTSADYRVYSNRDLYPLSYVEKGEAAFVGNRKFIPLMIYPFQYRAGTQELVVHERISISVNITGNKSAAKNWQLSPNPLDAASEAFFLNDASSKTWRKERVRDASYDASKISSGTVNEIQLIVNSEGIYKVTYQALMDVITMMSDSLQVEMAWTPASVDPRFLELSDEYGQVPINFVGENDGSFDTEDYFEFFGDRHRGDTLYMDDFTAENVYTLKLVNNYGARMVVENGGLVVSNIPANRIPDAYEETVHFEEQLVSDKLGQGWTSLNPEFYREDIWFWKKINAPNLEIVPVELQYPKDTNIRTASAKVSLMGLTYSDNLGIGEFDHEASVRLNQAMVNTHTWVGQTEKIFLNQAPISNTFLRHGTNNFYISLSGNTNMSDREQVLLDYAEIKYWREYKTDLDYIKFTKPSNLSSGLFQFELQGFSNPQVSVYKIGSSVFNNLQIEPFNIEGGAPWTVTLQDTVSSNAVRYYAVTEQQKKTPKLIKLNVPSDLRNPLNYAQMVVITPRQFIETEGTVLLKSIWESKGYVVKIVDIQDVYDEFNHGIVGAEPIKEFLRYAYNNWSEPQISHVMLLGEGVDDTRDNSSSRIYNLVPVKKTWTYKHGATASDNWYACIVGSDTIPDISISRIAVWKPGQILDYANKLFSYNNNPQTNRLWSSHLTFTSGGKITDVDDLFAQQSERIRRKSVPQDYRVTRVYTSTQTVSPDYSGGTFNLKDAINTGTQYVQFMGHGGGRVWADYNLFNFNDVATLNNTTFPVVLSLACYASAFDTNGAASISEALVLQPGKGAIGTAGFSGLGYEAHDEGWGLAFTDALFTQDFADIGSATIYALARFYTTVSSTAARYALTNAFAYLGDPLIKLRKPIRDIPVTADNHVLNPGEPLTVHAQFPNQVTAARLFVMKESGKVVNVPYDLPVNPNGEYTASYSNADTEANNYTRKIYVAGYSATDEYIGRSTYSVGRPGAIHVNLQPLEPAWTDSVSFTAKVFSPSPVISLVCKVRTDSTGSNVVWQSLPMEKSASDSTIYVTSVKLGSQRTGKEIFYKYVLSTETGDGESYLQSYVVRGPDLLLKDIKLEQSGQGMVLKVLGTNIGNATSTSTDLRLYTGPTLTSLSLYSSQTYLPLAVNEERWDSIDLSNMPTANLFMEARVNSSNSFPEWHVFFNTNNTLSMQVPYNYHLVDNTGATLSSIDNNLSVGIPANMVPVGSQSLFAVNALAALNPLNQPDVNSILLQASDGLSGNQRSIPYEIKVLSSGLTDSLGVFVNNKKVSLTFSYNSTDSQTHDQAFGDSYKVYRYNAEFQKWLLIGGYTNTTNNTVALDVDRTGIYSIFRNTDTTAPTIDVNVQEQEFTVGGVIAGNGVFSLLMSDANGINVIDDTIKLFLNGTEVQREDYVISVNLENINRIPIKYQLDLGSGRHELKIICRDLNGIFQNREIVFDVNDKFDITNIGNYPNPVKGQATDPKNDGRTRFTYILTDGADEVTIKVYTISGRLVKTFSNLPIGVGYHEYPRTVYGWDCKDEYGYSLANGVYFYRIIAKKGNKTLEKTMKMAILK